MASAIPIATGTSDVQAYTGPGVLVGCSFRENAGTPAVASIVLRDGTTDTGKIIAVINLLADESMRDNFPDIHFATGLFVEKESGETQGAVYIR